MYAYSCILFYTLHTIDGHNSIIQQNNNAFLYGLFIPHCHGNDGVHLAYVADLLISSGICSVRVTQNVSTEYKLVIVHWLGHQTEYNYVHGQYQHSKYRVEMGQ